MDPVAPATIGTWPRGFGQDTAFPWPLVRADDLVTLKYGKALLENKRTPGPIPVYGTNGQCGWHDRRLATGPGLILGRKGMGNLGVKWCSCDFWVIDTAYFVIPRTDELNLKFFYHLVNYIGLNHLKDGTSNPSLNRETFYAQLLPCPQPAVQRSIARILDSLDDKIECNRRMNRTLEEMARAVFRSWFVDFYPVRVKADGRTPTGMDAATAALFPDHFEDSELGKIPAGWKVGSVADLSTIHRETVDPSETPDQLVLHHSIPAFDEGQTPKQEAAREIKSNKTTVPEGVVLVSKLNPSISRVWIPVAGNFPSICSTEFVVLRPKLEVCSREYVYSLFSTAEMQSELEQRATGTSNSHQRVRPEDMMQTLCVLPGDAIGRAWTDIVRPLFQRIAANRIESQTLAPLRDALLPKLISGEVRVPV